MIYKKIWFFKITNIEFDNWANFALPKKMNRVRNSLS